MSDGRDRQVRILPGMFAAAQYWIEISKKDGGKISIPKFSRNFDPITATFDSTKPCPYQENQEHFMHKGEPGAQCQIHYYVNVLSRDLQDDEPKTVRRTAREGKTGFKDKSSKSWTPVRVLRLPPTVIKRLQKLKLMNRSRKARDGAPLSDPKLGRDILISFDSKATSPSEMWFVQLYEKQTALHEEEQEYLMYDIESAIEKLRNQETDEEAETWVQKQLGSGRRSKSEEDERPSRQRRRSRHREEPEDEEDYPDEDEDLDDEEESEDELDEDDFDEEPEEDEDEDDDYGSDELDDEEEDEDPPRRSQRSSQRSSRQPSSRRRRRVEESEDEDEPEEPEDDEEEEPPRRRGPTRSRSRAKPASRTRRRQPEPEEEDEEEEEEDPPKRARQPSRRRSGGKGSRSSDFKFNRRTRDDDVIIEEDIPF